MENNSFTRKQKSLPDVKFHHFPFGFLFPSAIKLGWPMIFAFSARETISVRDVNVLSLEGNLYVEQLFLERKTKLLLDGQFEHQVYHF